MNKERENNNDRKIKKKSQFTQLISLLETFPEFHWRPISPVVHQRRLSVDPIATCVSADGNSIQILLETKEEEEEEEIKQQQTNKQERQIIQTQWMFLMIQIGHFLSQLKKKETRHWNIFL